MDPITFTVTDTNLAALKAKKSAVDLGYMKDDFINFFVPSTPRKEVLLNKGYWCRSYIVNKLMQSFISNSSQEVQLISLGCGLDTAPFNIIKGFENTNAKFKFFETDLQSVVSDKIGFIKHNHSFKSFIEDHLKCQILPNSVEGSKYSLFPFDLNHPHLLEQTFTTNKVDRR